MFFVNIMTVVLQVVALVDVPIVVVIVTTDIAFAVSIGFLHYSLFVIF